MGPFEAVMDAYHETLFGMNDEPNNSANYGPEEHFAKIVREETANLPPQSINCQLNDHRLLHPLPTTIIKKHHQVVS